MHADRDLLLIAVFCTGDDLLPERPRKRPSKGHARGGRHPLCRPMPQAKTGIPKPVMIHVEGAYSVAWRGAPSGAAAARNSCSRSVSGPLRDLRSPARTSPDAPQVLGWHPILASESGARTDCTPTGQGEGCESHTNVKIPGYDVTIRTFGGCG
jgi:hypothetical protein